MDAVDFIEDYEKITEDNKTATFYHANTMFQFAEDYHQAKLKLLSIGDVSCYGGLGSTVQMNENSLELEHQVKKNMDNLVIRQPID